MAVVTPPQTSAYSNISEYPEERTAEADKQTEEGNKHPLIYALNEDAERIWYYR